MAKFQTPKSGSVSLGHWGAFVAHIENERLVRADPIGGADADMVGAWPELVHSSNRISQPHIRRGWLEKGPASSADRGKDEMVPVSWQDALDLAAREIARIQHDFGPNSILGGSYGWSSAGRLHHARSQVRRFLAATGGFTDQVGNYSWGAAAAILPHIVGTTAPVASAATCWDSIIDHTDCVVAFGGLNPKNWRVTSGGAVDHPLQDRVAQAQKRGCRFVIVSPTSQDIPNGLEADLIQPRPGSDTAIMLALAHEAWRTGRADKSFLARYTTGLEKLVDYLMGEGDGQPKSLQWAAEIADVPVESLQSLWHCIKNGRIMLTASWSLQRAQHGEQSYWALIALAAMLGQIGLPGGGFSFGYGSMGSVGAGARRGYVPLLPGLPNEGMKIPAAAFADALLHPGESFEFNGATAVYPDIRLIYWAGGNPFHHAQDLGKLEEAWSRPETVIVNEPWWTPTAQRADIVFPATTTAERCDIGGTSRDPHVVFMNRLVPPQGEARNDRDIFSALAERLGCKEAFTENLDEEGWLRRMWEGSESKGAKEGIEVPSFENLKEMGIWAVPRPDKVEVMFETFRKDPEANRLATPSGKIELYSDIVAAFHYDDHPGHAAFHEPEEWLGSASATQFHLISNMPEKQLHGQLWQTEAGMSGLPAPLFINDEDAHRLSISEGDLIRVHNERGACLATARPHGGIRHQVVVMPNGAWYEPSPDGTMDLNGNPNVLTSDRRTSRLGQACAALSALVWIEPFHKEE